MKPSLAAQAVGSCIKAGLVPILWGQPGAGKSAVIEQTVASLGYDFIVSHPSISDPVDYKGLPMPSADGETADFRPYGELLRYIKAEKPTVVFLDDLGQSSAAVMAAIMQVIWNGRIGDHKVSPHVKFVAASNRETDRAAVQRMITPLANRCIHINFEIDDKDWCVWALANNVLPEIVGYIRFRPNMLHRFDATAKEKAFPSPRSWEFLSRLLAVSPIRDTEYELFQGTIGEAATAEFLGYLKIYRELPNPDAVLMNPASADVPTEPATLHALTSALAHRVGENSIDRLVEYAVRLPNEYNVMLMCDVAMRHPKLKNTHGYIKWGVLNQELVV